MYILFSRRPPHRVLIWWSNFLAFLSSLCACGPVMGFSTALLALAHVLAANAGCDSLPSCGTCLANSGCGWCASSTSCMSIASDGTVEGTCSDFQGSQCVGGSRDSNSLRACHRTRPCLSTYSTQRRPELRSGPIADRRPTHCGRRAMQLLHDLQRLHARAFLHVQQREWSMRVPVRAALLLRALASHPLQYSTALHHPAPPTEHVLRCAQAGERETARVPVHGVWRKLRPMTPSTAAALEQIVQ